MTDYIKMPCDKIVKCRITLNKEIMLTQRSLIYIQIYTAKPQKLKKTRMFEISIVKALKSGKKSSSCTISIPHHSKQVGFVDLLSWSPSISNELAPFKHAHYVHLILINIVHLNFVFDLLNQSQLQQMSINTGIRFTPRL